MTRDLVTFQDVALIVFVEILEIKVLKINEITVLLRVNPWPHGVSWGVG
jgi:hypothetical protein